MWQCAAHLPLAQHHQKRALSAISHELDMLLVVFDEEGLCGTEICSR